MNYADIFVIIMHTLFEQLRAISNIRRLLIVLVNGVDICVVQKAFP